MNRRMVPQPVRYTFLLIELAVLLIANRVAFGTWLPATDPSGLWFYAALFGLLLGQRLDTPFFTTPKDAVLYAVPALVALLQIPDSAWAANSNWGVSAHALLFAWIVLVLAVSSIAVWLQAAKSEAGRRLAATTMQLSGSLGNPQAFFSVILLLVLMAFPPRSIEGLLILAAAWAITVPFSLLDYLFALLWRIRWSLAKGFNSRPAEVVHFQHPGLLVVRGQQQDSVPIGHVIAYRDPASGVRVALVMSHAGRDTGVLMRAIELGAAETGQAFPELALVGSLEVTLVHEGALSTKQKQLADGLRASCIGFVAPETDISKLIVDVATNRDLAAGRLVRTTCGDTEAFYQLTNGLTKEEIVERKNTHGFVAAHARSVGVWVATEARFRPLSWVPSPNAPVVLVEQEEGQFQREQIGTFPGTTFGVRLKNVAHVVTHNTAILGILGVGKSTLAMELVERVVEAGCKVIVLDLTDQYASELADLLDPAYVASVATKLQAAGEHGKQNVKKNVEEGGSRNAFAHAVEAELNAFMASGQRLLVLNPVEFEVWKQDSKPFQDTASMASLTACEIAYIVSDAAPKVVQKLGRTDSARLCLVYEEAHSLVPEWNATVADGDRASTNGTARAILQGRKYGLGCLLVTQRTASVTKTILNQCNTVFAMRSFDDTSKEFLANYIGRDYAALLPSLPERHAVFFGRASSCENPVHIQLNDRAEFVAGFRAHLAGAAQTSPGN